MFAPAALLAFAIVGMLVALRVGGAADVRAIWDPGAVVRYGLPTVRTIMNLAMAGMIGALTMAVWALSAERKEWRVALDLAAGSAGVVTVAATGALILTYVDVSGQPFSGREVFGAGLAQFVTSFELGQLWLWLIMLSAITTVLSFAVRDRRLVLLTLVFALAAALPLAQQGHAAGAASHAQAVNSLLVHLVGAAVWLGGLLTLVFVAHTVDRTRLATLVSRYSALALLAFIGVASSGLVSASLRVGGFEQLFTTGYGQIVVMKAGVLIVLGLFGVLWRAKAIDKIAAPGGNRFFVALVVLELAIMGIVSGLAGSLGRTPTPVALEAARETGSPTVSPAEWLTGDPLPPELTASSYFTVWKFDLAWSLVVLFGIALYLGGVWRLRKRGDRWPIGRTISWSFGMLVLWYATNGAFNAYEQYLFSQHMLVHMLLTMLIPLFLVLGAPITLLLRATHKRTDGSWGGREWVMWAVQTPYSKFITHPAVAAVIFAGSLWVFYFTPIFRWSTQEHLGHQWMIIHFLISGYLFNLSMVGIDPVPYRFPYPLRLVTLFATMASHAFFGVTIMSQQGLMLADWYGAMGRTWGLPPLADQSLGGGIAWGIGELPTLALALIVALQWSRNDDKVQRRKDRAADRSGEAELKAYNEMLARQAELDAQQAERSTQQ